ncbi:UDP-N-acetylglucosamine 46-dehydratase protein [Marine Group I thaumarchaeote SCGC AAA799-P11]|uniref:UDP-N-acetylglucosamine 46-dehydratase protein n=1 Tax=Marine Group I thaumarchaeote SCGC AAA799-P11 TaxID=1502295 RepID=A0A087S2Z2_9ARCH|nr:UDP-N-acetylglucosamine 46-dehydratase protein [Marine Group I thaumarchaeote SCGC AAA799-P11]
MEIGKKINGKTIVITGGTGSLGQALTKRLLKTEVKTIRIFSRNENKQITMAENIEDKDGRLRFFIGDVRDDHRLKHALEGADIVFHAAALKHVPVIEYNPFEGIKTNVIGSQNVIDACLHQDVQIAVGIGTDKAVSPLNTYGATKLLMEKLFVTANNYLNPKKHKTKFLALRYGNVLGSSGSVIPRFINMIKQNKKITITDPNMTRFSLTMDQALDFILDSTFSGKGSEIFVPKLKAYTIKDLKDALFELLKDTGYKKIPVRQGEKFHETLINYDEMRNTWENKSKYIILNPLSANFDKVKSSYTKIDFQTPYSSETVKKMSIKELKASITNSNLL